MILKGSQRGGARQLAAHLLNDHDNDHVTIQELRGFVADDLHGAMAEAHAVATGTKCRQCVFSLSLNPPKDASASLDDLVVAADRAEAALGLTGQPRALIIHEKAGRRHAHAVWGRIDPTEMRAINLPFFKRKLNALSRELYLENEWDLPDGYKTNGWRHPLTLSLAECQQAKRFDLDPREVKQVFRQAWDRSDGLAGFRNALEESGYYLAKGDRRGVVAVDINGEVFSASRWTGVSPKELRDRLGSLDALSSLEETRESVQSQATQRKRQLVAEDRNQKRAELKPLWDERRRMVTIQREERTRLDDGQTARWERESKERAARFRTGFGKVFDILTGKVFSIRRQNELEAYEGLMRDRTQRESLVTAQMKDREELQKRIEQTIYGHRKNQMNKSDKWEFAMPKDVSGRWVPESYKAHTYSAEERASAQKVMTDFDKARREPIQAPPTIAKLGKAATHRMAIRPPRLGGSGSTLHRPSNGPALAEQRAGSNPKGIADKPVTTIGGPAMEEALRKMLSPGQDRATKVVRREWRKYDLMNEFNKNYIGPDGPGGPKIKGPDFER
ncbi:relaxase/mobilization nuclease domain-containing protein [Phreatobacter stygius]|uniref:Relaxase n=1 Tax=Phreatobacter stygius TaxID=1940610 RepID=A0A4D7B7R6_9HYPH|nr:relaxase [Phreatobacter stygius]QCI63957.1 relaxase [Phreatobacter stygius]